MEKTYYDFHDIMDVLGISKTSAYKVIATLNNELVEQGYMIVKGKVYRQYFEKRYYYNTVA